jgi:sugar lactone lactonase YvrE
MKDLTAEVVVDRASEHAEGPLWSSEDDALLRLDQYRGLVLTGELLQRVLVDAPQVSSSCFGGEDLRTLLITTSQDDYTAEDVAQHPHAGEIFGVRTDTQGLPAEPHRPHP